MGILKAEMLQNGRFINTADALAELFAYINSCYNAQRPFLLNYRTPNRSEAALALAN